MRALLRAVGVWMLRGALAVTILVALDVAILALPYPFFSHRQQFGEFTVHSSRPIPDGFGQVIEEARARVAAMDHARPGERHRVFICGDERLYSLFARLTRRSPNSQAIGLAVFRYMYLNDRKIAHMAAHNFLGIRHSALAGNVAGVIAHEIAHETLIRGLGWKAALALPAWKSEGYAEYQANLAAKQADDSYDFADHAALFLDDAQWGHSPTAQQLFGWHVLVEFLVEEMGMGLEALARESVAEAGAREQLVAWYGQQRVGGLH